MYCIHVFVDLLSTSILVSNIFKYVYTTVYRIMVVLVIVQCNSIIISDFHIKFIN